MTENLRWVKLTSDWMDIPKNTPIGMDEAAARSLVGQRGMGDFCAEPAEGEERAIFYRDTGRAKMSKGKGKSTKQQTTKKKEVKEESDKGEGLTIADMAGK